MTQYCANRCQSDY